MIIKDEVKVEHKVYVEVDTDKKEIRTNTTNYGLLERIVMDMACRSEYEYPIEMATPSFYNGWKIIMDYNLHGINETNNDILGSKNEGC